MRSVKDKVPHGAHPAGPNSKSWPKAQQHSFVFTVLPLSQILKDDETFGEHK
jgi:hypothetical protein